MSQAESAVDYPGHAEFFDAAVAELQRRLRALPTCQRAATLRALVFRLQGAVQQQSEVIATVHQLAMATADALESDPWVQLDRVAHDLKRALEAHNSALKVRDNTKPTEGSNG